MTIKRLLTYLAPILPALALLFWRFFPQYDPSFPAPLFHFYIVTFTTFAATVLSLFVTISVGQTALPRHLLLALAFAWMGGVFFVHGLSTSGALIDHSHPGITWGAWLTLFGGGVIFVISGFAPPVPNPRRLRLLALAVLAIYSVFGAVALLAPNILSDLLTIQLAPSLATLVFWAIIAIWSFSSIKHLLNYRQTNNFFDGLMVVVSIWFATVTVSMFQFQVWRMSWWLYHFMLLLGFLISIGALWRAYEQVRAFRLVRYFAVTSLIVTVALALLSAQLYSQLVYQNLLEQLQSGTLVLTQSLASELASRLESVQTFSDLSHLPAADVEDTEKWAAERLVGLGVVQEVYVYDAKGEEVIEAELEEPTPSAPVAEVEVASNPAFQGALSGQTQLRLYEPGAAVPSYTDRSTAHVLEVFLPIRAGGHSTSEVVGVLWAVRLAPELTQELIAARRSGIGLAVLTLGGLFLALLALVRRADQLITQRTGELEKAYTDLRTSEGMRDDLTNMIIHDLRNPLTAVIASLEMVNRTLNKPEVAKQFMDGAQSAGQRMAGLIDDLLNVGKIEAGELRPVLQALDPLALLTDKANHYAYQAERDHKTITTRVAPDAPHPQADPNLIGRVLDNLISNALKYTSNNGHIELSAEARDGQMVFRVRDDGDGIPVEYQKRIFDKFVQVTDASGAPLRKGTGLGLAFCRLAVEAHGGQIWVESKLGEGSTFVFTVPLR